MYMNIAEIKSILLHAMIEELPPLLDELKADSRSGVQKLYHTYLKKISDYQKVVESWELRQAFDEVFHHGECALVGIDEVGRGPLAGPVVASAVILPCDCEILGLRDSKKLSEIKREELYLEIKEKALAIGIGIVPAEEIDAINILQATFCAMRQALNQINMPYRVILVDGDKIIPQVDVLQHAIIGGDDKSASIAAASIVAKVTRDRMMREYAKTYVVYDWENNKGYGSAKHYEAIRNHGITALHRKTFLKNEGIE